MPRIKFTLNDHEVAVDVRDDELLLDVLRDQFDATSVRYSCGIGVCGTCTVLVDGQPVSSCLQFAVMSADRDIKTAEGAFACHGGVEQQVLEAFDSEQAYQCSYCIPGMALTLAGVLAQEPDLEFDEARDRLGGNLCRCGSYPQVLRAVARVVGSQGGDR